MLSKTEVILSDLRSGDRIALGRAITLVESTLPESQAEARNLLGQLTLQDQALILAVSGAPGVGKSTFIDALGYHLIQRGKKVAILAVDPTSDRSGGSILGDKTRMLRLVGHPYAFIRPSPTSGMLGGIGPATYESTLLCQEAGYDIIIIETVGVGQSETVARYLSDLFMVLLQPGAGDELQGMKKGIIENADLLIVNKWDSDLEAEAEKTRAAYQLVWKGDHEKIMLTSSLQDKGIDNICDAILDIKEQSDRVQSQKERKKYWFLKRTLHLVVAKIRTTQAALFEQLQYQIASGEISYSDAIEIAVNKIYPQE